MRDCARRAWSVAFGLLRDRDDAFDAVQQALVVAARKPERIPSDDPWPWFGVVVAHEARNLRRKKRPTTNQPLGGAAMEPPDARRNDPIAVFERAESRERLRRALEDLPDAEREAVVLTHMAGMTHAAAAEALDIPRQTLTTHARDGRERLARVLRREPATLTRTLALMPIAMPPGGLEAATQLWSQSALGALGGGAAAVTTAFSGVGLMSSKTILFLSISVALGAGFLGARLVRPTDESTPGSVGSDSPTLLESGARSGDGPRLASPLAEDEADLPALRRENRALRGRLARVEQEASRLKGELGAENARRTAGPTFTFGRAGRLDAVRKADWAEMAEASVAVSDSVLEIFKHRQAGTAVPREVYLRVQENAEKMRKYEYRALDKIPTEAKHNGEITHPITLANLVAAVLEGSGRPLDEAQIARVRALGIAFEAAQAELMERYGGDTPRVKRMLEEYRLKGRFHDDLTAVLTTDQRAVVVNPETRGIAGLDLYGPTLMILHSSPVLTGSSAEEIGGKLRAILEKKFGLDEKEAAGLAGPISSWARDVEPLLAPVALPRIRHYTYEQGIAAGEATVSLYQRLLEELRLSDEGRKALLEDYAFYIPRVVES